MCADDYQSRFHVVLVGRALTMNVYRILISFIAGTIVVLAMLVTGLQLFSGRQAAPTSVADDFTVEYPARPGP